uniref:non-specific serine/threonine protein kinase n=1 Tax=Erpetoichthys calabaricus TaxID=27687 RepID=A0A8C4SHQ6_ERPCA
YPLNCCSPCCLPQADQAAQVPMEIGLMLLVSGATAHSGIIQLLDWYVGTTKMAMVMELLDSSMNLTEFIMRQGSSLTEKKAKLIFSQLVEAVRHCHFFWVFHGDLKPDNILIQTTTEKIKLIDFGCGKVLQEKEDYTSYSGSLMYAPPEWFLQSRYSAVPATVWSLGVILFELLCGHCPFIRTDDIVKVKFKFNRDLSAECQDLIKKCFSFSPLERPTLEELQFHPWIF